MQPAPPSATSWFEDERELLRLASRDAPVIPSVPGYENLQEFRRGGQGVVYTAEQRTTRQTVAIKVLLAGSLAGPSHRRRFEREAELAASLRHPNIVRVFDSGVTPEGWPFLVMEYVEGRPLDAVIAGPASVGELDARVVLFEKIVRAVAYAHQRGIIHRDLKPGNIRVDDTGEPRILDFGLAKSVFEDAGKGVTRSGQFVGSLPWAAPEQTGDEAESADVRSDVYALGVMLYQALTGRMPYDTGGSLAAAVHSIRTAMPAAPRSIVPAVGEDLSAVALRCLAKEPERRYQSAAELADDLAAYLRRAPIAARRDSAWYTLRVAARRYRQAAWFGAAFAMVISGALLVSVRAAREAARERDVARDQADKARAVSDFVRDMLTSPDPSKDGREVKVVDVLAAASIQADKAFADRPRSLAAVQNALGVSYTKLGLFEEGLARHQAAGRAAAHLEPESDEWLTARGGEATCLTELGRGSEALPIAETLVEVRSRQGGPDDPRTLDALTILGTCLDELGRSAEAEPIKRHVADSYRRIRGTDDPDSILSLNNLAMNYHRQGKIAESTSALEEVLAAQRRVGSGETAESQMTAVNLASAYKVQGRFDEALALLESAYADAERIWGPEHTQTLITANNYADLLMNRGELARAEPILLHVLEVRRRVNGPHHERTLGVLSNVGTLYRNKGEDAAAGPYFREAAEGAVETLGPSHRTSLILRSNYAGWLSRHGEGDRAAAEYRAIVETAREALGEENWMVGAFECNLSQTLIDLGRREEADPIARIAYERLLRLLGPEHDRTRTARTLLDQLGTTP